MKWGHHNKKYAQVHEEPHASNLANSTDNTASCTSFPYSKEIAGNFSSFSALDSAINKQN